MEKSERAPLTSRSLPDPLPRRYGAVAPAKRCPLGDPTRVAGAGSRGVADQWSFPSSHPHTLRRRWCGHTIGRMTAESETTTYYVRGTDPTNGEQVTFECVGFAMAYAKAAELRMSGYRDVVTSKARADDNPA
jgi:hypothetical protein